MPAISKGKVLVSGASGFIAAWIIRYLLEQGFHVRGTVRSPAKGEYLKQKLFGEWGDAFEYVVVEDMAQSGAFDEAVVGVDGIMHTASPVSLVVDDPEELIRPAVQGTRGLLLSAALHAGQNLKRVVITSSLSAVTPGIPDPSGEPVVLEESKWNESGPKDVKERGKDALPMNKYRASKVLAERSAWDFIEEYEDKIPFDLVTINPPYVFGPFIQEASSPENVNTSIKWFYQSLKAEPPKTDEELAAPIGSFVDVRDAATAHIRALTVEEAGGNRFVLGNGEFTWQTLLDAIPSGHPAFSKRPAPLKGTSSPTKFPFVTDSTKSRRVLKLEYMPLEKMVGDMVDCIVERGW